MRSPARHTLPVFLSLACILTAAWAAPALAEDGVDTLADIRLGDPVSAYHDLILPKTALPADDSPFIIDVNLDVARFPGLRSGSIGYGNCEDPGKVVRVKCKFARQDKALYDELYDAYAKRFGKPQKWMGNAFHTVIAWQWTIGSGAKRTTLQLMYSELKKGDPGVSLKFTNSADWQRELNCFKKQLRHEMPGEDKSGHESFQLDDYVPR